MSEIPAPSSAEILRRLGELARPHLSPRTAPLADGGLTPSLRLIEDLQLDSLAQLALLVEIENDFEIALEPEDEAELATVADLISVIVRRRTIGT